MEIAISGDLKLSFFLNLFKSRPKQISLSICGLDKAGKTTLINYLIKGEFTKTLPTMGINHEEINFPKLRLNIYDLGGQEDFRGTWSQVNEKSNALIYVVDSTDYLRINETKEIFYNIINNQIDQQIPVMILLNKIDLPDRISRKDFIDRFGFVEYNLKVKWACFETSAKTGEGILDSFNWFVKNMLNEV